MFLFFKIFFPTTFWFLKSMWWTFSNPETILAPLVVVIFNPQNGVPQFFGWVHIIREINTNIFMNHRYGHVLTYIDVIGFKAN